MATPQQVAEFRAANRSLVLLAQSDVRAFWGALNTTGDLMRVKAALFDFFPELVAVYGGSAALLGADWYDMLRDAPPSATSFRARLADGAGAAAAVAAAGWAIGPLFSGDPNPAQALQNLLGSTQRLVLAAGRETFLLAAEEDARMRVGRDPEPGACDFCKELAAEGLMAPAEARRALASWHDHCECVLITG